MGFISPNDGTIWSSLFDGSTLGSYPVTNAFDGNTSTFMYPAAGTTITWTAPNGGIRGDLIEVYVYAGNTHPIVKVNGVSTGAVVGSDLGQQGNWIDVTSLVGGNLKTITSFGETIGGIARQSGFSAVRIDGEILVDGKYGLNGGRNGLSGSVFFGGASNGTATDAHDYLELADSSDWNATGDFCLEAWVFPMKAPVANQYGAIASQWEAGGGTDRNITLFMYHYNNDFYFKADLQTSAGNFSVSGPDLTEKGLVGQWHHLAWVRSSNTVTLYLNGISVGTDTVSGTVQNSTVKFMVGAEDNGSGLGRYGFNGYISNLRFCIGHPVYTANFNPPTSPLTVHYTAEDDKTVLLCCQDSDNPLQEATGKTITGRGRYAALTGELFSDPGFNTSDGWTGAGSGGWATTGNGLATHTQGTAGNLYQDISNLDRSATYKLSVDVLSSDNDVAYFYVEGYTSDGTTNYQTLGNRSNATVGHYEMYFRPTAATREIGFRGSSLFNGTISNLRLEVYEHPPAPKLYPPFGTDDGVTFGGAISQNTQEYMYFPTGRTDESGRGRVVIAGGTNPDLNPYMTRIDFFNITTDGNTLKFGDLSFGSRTPKGMVSSTTRAVYAGGMGPSSEVATNSMSYITIATTGNGKDFGDLTEAGRQSEGCSNNTRGIYFSGQNDSPSPGTNNNIIDYITTATLGNAVDFGDQTNGRDGGGACQSTVRGVYAGGDPSPYTNTIDYITIASTGDATNFGDLTVARTGATGCSNSIRGLFMSGRVAPTNYNIIEFITIATTGDAQDFGDLPYVRIQASAAANKTRGVLIGGNPGSSPYNHTEMSKVTIDTTGDAVDFGDCFPARTRASCSDSHGGLS